MGSFNGSKQNPGPDRRRVAKNLRQRSLLAFEYLESRQLLTATTTNPGPSPIWHPSSANLSDVQNGPMANAGQDLIGIYQAFQHDGGDMGQVTAAYPFIEFSGNSVNVDVQGFGAFSTFLSQMQSIGVRVTASDSTHDIVEGLLPISSLPNVAEASQTVGLHAVYKPMLSATTWQGNAHNEADDTLNGPQARQTFGVNGAGVTVGVLSDSVSEFQGGLPDSVKTGDLPSNVNVIQDLPAGLGTPTDEGRGMLENIHDIAPGAGLAFATAGTGEVGFADNIRKLASQAGAKVIVDDIAYLTEPMFQDGIVSQGVIDVTRNNGTTYFSAAHNSADHGYMSQFRPVQATPGQLPAGTYMNFDPGSGVTTLLPITTDVNVNGGGIVMNFDQPWYTTAGVTSQVNIYLLDANGAVVATANSNNIAQQTPFQFLDLSSTTILPNTQYFVAIQLASGPAPKHVMFSEWGDFIIKSVSQQFGGAGGTFYPTTFGHATSADAIGVGAVPWWGTQQGLTPSAPPVLSEPFSSTGPSLIEYDSQGNPLAAPQLRLKPDISAPDGGNTSFFGQVIDTSQPSFPGQATTGTNLSQNLPSFFGTSSASPNAAAVAALMLQKRPGLTSAQIRNAMIASAQPLNGAAPGTWNAQGGFGMIDAVKALSSIAGLQVLSTNPANGATLTQAPGVIQVTFSEPVQLSSLNAADLVFTSLPPGVAAAVFGTPIAVDNPTTPTIVDFPITFNTAPGVLANGNFTFKIQGAIVAVNGDRLTAGSPISFTLADTTLPRVANTTINGRIITVQFSEAVRPSTVVASNFALLRAGGLNASFGSPTNVNVNLDPRVKISYNPATFTATLDYTSVPQSEMPTDQYDLIINAGYNGTVDSKGNPILGPGIQDLAGNYLNGHFNGVFPSGVANPVTPQQKPTGTVVNNRFVQAFGPQFLVAPVVTSLQLTPASDTGLKGDGNTSVNQPQLVGQVFAPFPGSVAGLTVLVEFLGLHENNPVPPLSVGGGDRGFKGWVDAQAKTDANGTFTIQAPNLPEGFNGIRVVVQGLPDQAVVPGFSSLFQTSIRVDRTPPDIVSASLTAGSQPLPLIGSNLASLSTISLNVMDVANPSSGILATPAGYLLPALDPATADNLSNYSLINTDTNTDESSFIATANFVPTDQTFTGTPSTTAPPAAYYGRIDLTFHPGLPSGHYKLVAHTAETVGGVKYTGLLDAAGNPLDNSKATNSVDFTFSFALQQQPTFITNLQLESSYSANNSTVIGGPRSYFELPSAGTTPRASAPPTTVVIDLSTPIPVADYSKDILLVGSANSPGGTPDGDFGQLGEGGLGTTGIGFSVVPGTTVTLGNSATGILQGQTGFDATQANRLVLTLPQGTTLTADYYRIYVPNSGATAIKDVFGNQLDGEFLGNPAATGGYEDELPTGQFRQGLSGDGVGGGAFMTAFVVVPNGNIIFAKPDAAEPVAQQDGSLANPFPALAPEYNPATAPANPNHDPLGGINAANNAFTFDTAYDRNGSGSFDRSALYAAQQLSTRGPVVVVALPGTPTRNPITGVVTTKTFVLQAPSGSNTVLNDGSASVPFDTTLVFSPGSALKLQNASLYVQNQGSALQINGGPNPNDQVNFTSVNDNTVGGNTTGSQTNPSPGDWGGIIFRNFDNVTGGRNLTFPIDGTLQGLNGGKAISGAQDAMSSINFASIRFAGGAVPQTIGQATSAITLFNSRPAITNTNIAQAGTPGGTAAGGLNLVSAISADFDSFREDDTARGPLFRRVTLSQNSVNGILVRPDSTGTAEASDAIIYPNNPTALGGARNFVFDDPLPYVLTSQLLIGQQLQVNTGGQTQFVNNRLYIQPGMMVKSQRGAGIAVVNNNASINIGSRTYINEFDANPDISPSDPNFKPNPTTDARVLFTSIYDNTATTTYFDPSTQTTTTIVPALDSGASGGANQPTPGNVPTLARWGSVSVQSGAVAVINDAEFRYGGGQINGPEETFPQQSVLAFITDDTPLRTPLSVNGAFDPNNPNATPLDELGTHVMVTDNNFFDNLDTAMQIEPNGLMAGDALRPLLSGHPFFRGNVMQRNDIDGLGVVSSNAQQLITDPSQPIGRVEAKLTAGNANLTVNSVWDSTDLTYVLRGSIVLAGAGDFRFRQGPGQNGFTTPDPTKFGAEPSPAITLTIQSALPGTLLADGTSIPRPGESVMVKLWNEYAPQNAGALDQYGSIGVTSGDNVSASTNVGAGFVVGVDDGVDPPSTNPFSPLVDPGAYSQIRILGIPGNETTGQQRVPAIITSLRDNTVGQTVRGVKMFNIWEKAPLNPNLDLTTPQAGDGGYIYFGSNSLTDYNLQDPRDGNIIDDADIRYMTRIEIQAGGIIDINSTGTQSFGQEKLGQTPITQYNSAQAMTISNSNLAFFKDAAIFAHANSANALERDLSALVTPTTPPTTFFPITRDQNSERTQGLALFLYGNTISNSPVGVEVHSDAAAPDKDNDPEQVVLLHNTFYNDDTALHTNGFGPPNTSPFNFVYFLAMDNIFANSKNVAVQVDGYADGSQMQYNLFWQNDTSAANPQDIAVALGAVSGFQGNFGAVIGDPAFLDPANLNFQLGANSAAIDAARSEIGPLPGGDAIYPTVTQQLDANGNPTSTSIRIDPTTLTAPATPGRSAPRGGFFNGTQDPRKIVSLPGQPYNAIGFFNQWVPTLTTDPAGVSGPASNIDTYNFTPISGIRDALGNLRVDDPAVGNSGFGTTYYDIGAYEFRQYNPPHVDQVTATINNATGTGQTKFNIYKVGGVAGTNQTPQNIQIKLNHALDTSTINGNSVLLQESGGDGIFGNSNSPTDRFINLAGKLTFDASTDILTIHLADAGLVLTSDEYRLVLQGSGSNILRDTQGNALDGENLDTNNLQKDLPSGDTFPGGNFSLTFTVNTQPSTIVPGTFQLSPSSDSNVSGDNITFNNKPSFTGTITDLNPAINPLAGQIVVIDVSTKGNGVWDRMNAGTASTNAQGQFVVTVGTDGANTGLVTNTSGLPDSPYSVGANGLLNSSANAGLLPGQNTDDTGSTMVRVRIIDASGNSSSTTDPNSRTTLIVDSRGPTVTSISPTQGTLLKPNSSGVVPISFTVNKNITPSTLTANSINLIGAGPDGNFGTADDTTVSINPGSLKITPLKNGAQGPEQIDFSVSPGLLKNGLYELVLKGTGPNPITDIAGNPLSGANGTGGKDFMVAYVAFNPGQSNTLFVGGGNFVTDPTAAAGSRANPYPTITDALAAAVQGDVVAVLPGVYTESIILKSLVHVESADPSSTAGNVVPGSALNTIIRAPANNTSETTVMAVNLFSVAGLDTEISGFTIASPLLGDPAFGVLDAASAAVRIVNSNVLVDNNYIIDSGFGIANATSGINALQPRVLSNVVVGNNIGMITIDLGTTSESPSYFAHVFNNTFAFNTIGFFANVSAGSPIMAEVANSIFWENHDQTAARGGAAIVSTTNNKIIVRSNMFQGNGPSETLTLWSGIGVGNGFNNVLRATPDSQGNFAGQPFFVRPRDPRPGGDGPGGFFMDADFSLMANSAAIDAANKLLAPDKDFLGGTRVDIPGRGFPGTGPADDGAFEFQGGGGAVGGAFRVVTTSLANGAVVSTAPSSIVVSFSGNVNRNTVTPNDLVIAGYGVNAANPAHATSLTWIDNHTVRFNLSGKFNNSGPVAVALWGGSVANTSNAPNARYLSVFSVAPPKPAVVATIPAKPAVVATIPPVQSPKAVALTPPAPVVHKATAKKPVVHKASARVAPKVAHKPVSHPRRPWFRWFR
jgi:hypothetical protein